MLIEISRSELRVRLEVAEEYLNEKYLAEDDNYRDYYDQLNQVRDLLTVVRTAETQNKFYLSEGEWMTTHVDPYASDSNSC